LQQSAPTKTRKSGCGFDIIFGRDIPNDIEIFITADADFFSRAMLISSVYSAMISRRISSDSARLFPVFNAMKAAAFPALSDKTCRTKRTAFQLVKRAVEVENDEFPIHMILP